MSDKILTALAKLREPFAENQISQLPKPMKKREEMDKISKANCSVCGGYHATSSIIHLAYVGHAALTDRLLEVDPLWTWEPLALDQAGLPLLDRDGGMWIKLTICGVTRLGYGDAQGKSGGDATKERIGDALRNAAMRFGAALDLWHKGDLHADPDDEDGRKKAARDKAQEGVKSATQGQSAGTVDHTPASEGEGVTEGMKKTIRASLTKKDVDEGRLLRAFKVESMDQLKKSAINEILAWINGEGQS